MWTSVLTAEVALTEGNTTKVRAQMDEGARIEAAIRGAMGRTKDARSLSALARKAGIQRATLYAWFSGQRPEHETQAAVAAALGVSRSELWPMAGEHPADLSAALAGQAAAITSLMHRPL
jgi:DNA-binding phage protein